MDERRKELRAFIATAAESVVALQEQLRPGGIYIKAKPEQKTLDHATLALTIGQVDGQRDYFRYVLDVTARPEEVIAFKRLTYLDPATGRPFPTPSESFLFELPEGAKSLADVTQDDVAKDIFGDYREHVDRQRE